MRFYSFFRNLAPWLISHVRQVTGLVYWLFLFGRTGIGWAHPMPNTLVVLTVHEHYISGEIHLPLGELQSAIGMQVNDQSDRLIERLGDSLNVYLGQHLHPQTLDNQLWHTQIGAMHLTIVKNNLTGDYKELTIAFVMSPPEHYDLRNFKFDYDGILREVASHKILVSVKQDWARGHLSDREPTQLGVIELDVPSGKVLPLQISLAQGSLWKGFASMVKLGTQHIAEGTDHLLFLLVLLLPAPLLTVNGRWSKFGGIKHSLFRLVTIVTAFTMGHSLTLLLGALGWVNLPSQPIELLIAVSIMVSAIHAIRPLFPGRETWIAAGFGLIHGLAFASVLANLQLDSGPMALSILGFNVGIELMQLLVIALTIPWLILLSRTPTYRSVRIGGGLLAGVAATAWLLERLIHQPNLLTRLLEAERSKFVWLLIALAGFALWMSWRYRKSARSTTQIY